MKALTRRARGTVLATTLAIVSVACAGNQSRLREEARRGDQVAATNEAALADSGTGGMAAIGPDAADHSSLAPTGTARTSSRSRSGSGPSARSSGGTTSGGPAAQGSTSVGRTPGSAGSDAIAGPGAIQDAPSASGASVTAANPGATDIGITADRITIGGVWFHESYLDRYSRVEEHAVRAFFNEINRAGGIHGRKIDYISCTDGGDNSRSRACFKDLVENKKVFMLGPSASWSTGTIQQYVKAQKIPFVGSFGLYLEEYENDNLYSFPTQVPVFDIARLFGRFIVDEVKPTTVGISYLNIEAAQQCMKGLDAYLSKVGIRVVAKVSNEVDEPDLTPQVLRMRQANPELIAFCNDPVNDAKFVSASRSQRYKPEKGWIGGWPTVPEFGKIVGEWGVGHYGFSSVCYHEAPECDADPDVQLFKAQMARHYPGEMERMHYYGQNLWCGAKMLTEALRMAGPNLTRTALLSALDSGAFYNWTCQGMQLLFKAGVRAGSRVGQMLQLDSKLRWRLVKPTYRAD